MSYSAPAAAVLALSLALAGCIQLDDQTPATTTSANAPAFRAVDPLAIEDAAGDAKELGFSRIGYGPGCLISCGGLPVQPNAPGQTADAFDILSAGLTTETPDAFVLTLTLAELTEGFPELAATGPQHRVGEYFVCWDPAQDADATRCALADVHHHAEGVTVVGSLHLFSKTCNDWEWCAYSIPVEVVYGAPGEIRFTIPKEVATADGAPLAVVDLRAASGWFSTNAAIPMWHFAWTVHMDGNHQHDHAGLLEPGDVADRARGEHDPVLLTPATPRADTAWRDTPLMTPGPGNLAGANGIRDYPELDLLSFDFREDGTDLVGIYTLAGLEEMPTWDLQFATIFGVREGTTYEVGVMQSNGDAYGYAGRCISFGCHEGFLVKVPLDVTTGSPGTMEIRVDRAIWEDLIGGGVIDLTIAYTMYGEANVDLGEPGAPVYGNVHSGSVVDVAFGGTPFVLHPVDVEPDGHDHEH